MPTVCKLETWDTQLNADCVEFCPFEPYYSSAIVGTYQLCENDDNKESTRVGRLSLHNINSENCDLNPTQTLDTPGILDIKWCRKKVGNEIYLGAANALGQVILYSFGEEDCSISQHHVLSIGKDRLALSCDWFNGEKIAVSDSKGELTCLHVSSSGSALVNSSWKSHDYEAWVTSFDRHSGNMIYSGGDDSCFRLWDLRDLNSAVLTNKKAHQMGVTSIESSPINCNLLATGSYDERLLLWDKRQMKTWTSETFLGGGVWKMKWDPCEARYLLVAAMHNGFHIVDSAHCSPEGKQDPKLISSYKEHSSLAYGCDWCRDPRLEGKLIATCSFYDHCLQAWTWSCVMSAETVAQ